MTELMLDWDHSDVPSHTRVAIEDYLIRGYSPGSFVSAVMANDFVRAATSCDHINRESLTHIARWVFSSAPSSAWGSRQIVQDWLDDVNDIRTEYSTEIEKRFIWKKLNQK